MNARDTYYKRWQIGCFDAEGYTPIDGTFQFICACCGREFSTDDPTDAKDTGGVVWCPDCRPIY